MGQFFLPMPIFFKENPSQKKQLATRASNLLGKNTINQHGSSRNLYSKRRFADVNSTTTTRKSRHKMEIVISISTGAKNTDFVIYRFGNSKNSIPLKGQKYTRETWYRYKKLKYTKL